MTSQAPHHDVYPDTSHPYDTGGLDTDTTISDLDGAAVHRMSESGAPTPRRRSTSGSGGKKERRLNRSNSKKDGGKLGEKNTVSSVGEKKKRKSEKSDKKDSGLVSEGKGWKFRNGRQVRFAPMNVPLQRRLETAAVLWFSTAIAIFLSLFWFFCAIPLFWPIIIPYLIYILRATVHEDGSPTYTRSNFMRRLPIWKYYKNYFPISLHRTVPLDPTKNYIFAYHPHGIIGHGAFGSFVVEEDSQGGAFSRLFPGIRNTLLTLDNNFRCPLYREYLLSLGLASVSRRSCENLLRGMNSPIIPTDPSPLTKPLTLRSILLLPLTLPIRILTCTGILRPTIPVYTPSNPAPPLSGRAITIVIGGAAESLYAHPGTLNLILLRRRGFLKLALRENALLVPTLAFGENDIYEQLTPSKGSMIHRFQQGVKRAVGFTLPLFHARGVFNYDVGVLPYRKDINVVVGRPVGLKGMGEEGGEREGTDDEVKELMDLYIKELKRIWDTYKDDFAKNRKEGPEGEMVLLE